MLILTETPGEGALVLAERLREALEALDLRPKGTPVRVTASFGVAAVEDLGDVANVSVEALTTRVDDALYEAKKRGRNWVVRL